MAHFAVVFGFCLAIKVEVGARVLSDVGLGLLDMLAKDVEHDGWGVEFDGWEGLAEDA